MAYHEAATALDASSGRYLRILDDPWFRLLVEVQDLISYETAAFWRQRRVKCLHLPITTNSISSPMGSGSDSLPVEIDLYGVRTFLADSMQFMLEYGCRLAAAGTYYLMPSFRGEPADATHLNQFFHSEAELPGGLEDVIQVADDYVRHLAAAALEQLSRPLAESAGGVWHVEHFLSGRSARLTFDEASDLLKGEEDLIVERDGYRTITREGERRLMEKMGQAVWLTEHDKLAVPFYQARGSSGRTALNADLLLGPGEVVGCGERHVTGAEVRAALVEHGVHESDYQWYVALKASRPMRTSGFGMGVERFIMWLLGEQDIRQVQLLERYNGLLSTP